MRFTTRSLPIVTVPAPAAGPRRCAAGARAPVRRGTRDARGKRVGQPAKLAKYKAKRDFAKTPEPSGSLPPVIATVTVLGEFDYRVTRIANEGNLIHVSLMPRRDPDRNRLRELYVDSKTLELKELVATDKLYEEDSGRHVYAMLFTVTMGWMNGMPIVTHIHGTPTYQQDADYLGRDATVDYDFNDITFPNGLPEWYFDPRSYAQNVANAPM